MIPTETVASPPIARGEPLRIAVYAKELAGLAATLGVSAPPPGTDRLEYVVGEYPQIPARVDRSWLESSFVIDYLEPDAIRVRDEMIASSGAHPSRGQLVTFVAGAVKEIYGRGWDIASTVARRREGDCTEHAVLTAALARATGMPARVVVGMALVSENGSHAAFGHAWAEVREQDRWVVADAALHGAAAEVRYVPYGVLTDEGPGYTLGLARLSVVWAQRVVVLGSARVNP